MNIHLNTYVNICTCVYASMCTHTDTPTQTCMHMHIHKISTITYICVIISLCKYLNIHTCTVVLT